MQYSGQIGAQSKNKIHTRTHLSTDANSKAIWSTKKDASKDSVVAQHKVVKLSQKTVSQWPNGISIETTEWLLLKTYHHSVLILHWSVHLFIYFHPPDKCTKCEIGH